MRYETGKSLILTLLVLISIVLTWNLWTYQPNYDTMPKSNTVAEVSLSEKQEVQKIIRPDQIIFHKNSRIYGTSNTDQLDKVMREVGKWTFSDVSNYTERALTVKDIAQKKANTEIIFPGDIPIGLYRSVLNFDEKKIPNFNFNRMIIDLETSGKEYGTVYFVSTDYQQVYTSSIALSYISEFSRAFYKNAEDFPRYFAFSATERRTLYLPEKETQMTVYKYLPVTLNSEEFKEALFTDPSFVQKSSITKTEEYTNAFSKMTVNNNTNILSYINPTTDTSYVESSYDLVKRSIDFVNGHGGWTDPYRFVSKNELNHSVTFRLYTMDGYPVFNDRGVSEITEIWGRDEINKYIRPNIALELPMTTQRQKITRPSGHDVISFLKEKKSFKPELLDQIILGYRMERDSEEQQLILLEPAWFYRYDKIWREITMEDLGGLKHGLE